MQRFGITPKMPSTTTYSFGDVVLFPFPFTDQSATKKRPAVVVSSHAYNRARPDLILMAITGHLSAYPRIGEVIISGWKEAGLLKASTIKPILATIEKTLIFRGLGQLGQRDVQALRDGLKAGRWLMKSVGRLRTKSPHSLLLHRQHKIHIVNQAKPRNGGRKLSSVLPEHTRFMSAPAVEASQRSSCS